MGKASRLPERATTAKPTDTKSTESQRPTWSCLPLTRTEFAHGLPSYLSRINPKYKYFIEYAALHDCGVTFANSKVAAAVAQGCGGGGTRLRRRWHDLRRRWHRSQNDAADPSAQPSRPKCAATKMIGAFGRRSDREREGACMVDAHRSATSFSMTEKPPARC